MATELAKPAEGFTHSGMTDPGAPPASGTSPTRLGPADEAAYWMFYDGNCGLCHGVVKWLLPRDRAQVFLFAPLHGESFEARIPPNRQHNLPDSIVLLTPKGEVLVKSRAIWAMLGQIDNPWRLLGSLLAVIPRVLSDFGYDFVAKIRHHLFKKPDDVCPIVPPEQRSRFRP
jgi:predicted DCC family thiol-disulfide oxidoreductase YuxK